MSTRREQDKNRGVKPLYLRIPEGLWERLDAAAAGRPPFPPTPVDKVNIVVRALNMELKLMEQGK